MNSTRHTPNRDLSIDAIIRNLLNSKNLYADIFGKYRARINDIIARYPDTLSLGLMLLEHLNDMINDDVNNDLVAMPVITIEDDTKHNLQPTTKIVNLAAKVLYWFFSVKRLDTAIFQEHGVASQIIDSIKHDGVTSEVLYAIASNTNTTTAILEQLLAQFNHKKVDRYVLAAIAHNTNTTTKMLKQILALVKHEKVDRDWPVLLALASNNNANSEILEQVLAQVEHKEANWRVLRAIANHPNVNAYILHQLLERIDYAEVNSEVLVAIMTSHNASVSILQWFLEHYTTSAKITFPVLKSLAANSHYTDEVMLTAIKAEILHNATKLRFYAEISSGWQLAAIITKLLQSSDDSEGNLNKIKQELYASPVEYLLNLGNRYNDAELAMFLSNCYAKNQSLYNYPIKLPDHYANYPMLRGQIAILSHAKNRLSVVQPQPSQALPTEAPPQKQIKTTKAMIDELESSCDHLAEFM